jgi:glycosyltransferase involved in cell wall biosynthesis
MRVSCICTTFNRPPEHQWLLEEAIESFLRQDYPDRELIVLNDCPGQELVCEAPDVVVINVPRRFRSLGEKCNAAVALASGELIAPWDDDDVSLPWRLSRSLDLLGGGDYLNPHGYWFFDGGGLHLDHPIGYSHNCSIFTRRAFDLVGGYSHRSGGQDVDLDTWFASDARIASAPALVGPADWWYVYRWGVSPVHLSARAQHDAWYADVGTLDVRPGRYELRPRWQVDWVAEVHRALRATATVAARGA